jgi:hypothetical protein
MNRKRRREATLKENLGTVIKRKDYGKKKRQVKPKATYPICLYHYLL